MGTLNVFGNQIIDTKPDVDALPIGAIQIFPQLIDDDDYLLLDGSEFNPLEYPALYSLLGATNVLPDFRECTAVGTTASTITFIDDAIISHTHSKSSNTDGTNRSPNTCSTGYGSWSTRSFGNGSLGWHNTSTSVGGRLGTTTHGKQKGTYYYVRAR